MKTSTKFLLGGLGAVVIGEQMTLPEARALRSRAVSQGLSNDTYLWTFPGQR
jgi:hypothetical protein